MYIDCYNKSLFKNCPSKTSTGLHFFLYSKIQLFEYPSFLNGDVLDSPPVSLNKIEDTRTTSNVYITKIVVLKLFRIVCSI